MAFTFGLLHGFGFASALAEFSLPKDMLVSSLIAFNLGVEAGQLAIILVFFPLAFGVRKSNLYQTGVMKLGSVAVAIIAAAWLIERSLDLTIF